MSEQKRIKFQILNPRSRDLIEEGVLTHNRDPYLLTTKVKRLALELRSDILLEIEGYAPRLYSRARILYRGAGASAYQELAACGHWATPAKKKGEQKALCHSCSAKESQRRRRMKERGEQVAA